MRAVFNMVSGWVMPYYLAGYFSCSFVSNARQYQVAQNSFINTDKEISNIGLQVMRFFGVVFACLPHMLINSTSAKQRTPAFNAGIAIVNKLLLELMLNAVDYSVMDYPVPKVSSPHFTEFRPRYYKRGRYAYLVTTIV